MTISQRMESRVSAGKRVQSAPEVRHLTPPNLKRTKQGCPLTFTELVKAEEVQIHISLLTCWWSCDIIYILLNFCQR